MSRAHRPTALYRLFSQEGDLLYVGVSLSTAERFATHRREKPWWSEVRRIDLEWFPSRSDAARAELAAIRSEEPRHNVVGLLTGPWPEPEPRPEPRPEVDLTDYASRLEAGQRMLPADLQHRLALSVEEAASVLGISVKAALDLPAVRVGRVVRVPVAALPVASGLV